MIRFTVTWLPRAEQQLAAIWLSADDRPSIAAAANQIDTELSVDPQNKGLEFHEGLREVLIGPLMVLFTVHMQDRIVEVVRIKHLA